MDYVHYTEIPDDITPEILSEFGSNYEYRFNEIKLKFNKGHCVKEFRNLT
jgi:hypothetical protein